MTPEQAADFYETDEDPARIAALMDSATEVTARPEPCCDECAESSARSVAIWRGIGMAIGGTLMLGVLLLLLRASTQGEAP